MPQLDSNLQRFGWATPCRVGLEVLRVHWDFGRLRGDRAGTDCSDPQATITATGMMGHASLFFQEALKRSIKRSFFNLQQVVGCSFNVLLKSVAVQRLSL